MSDFEEMCKAIGFDPQAPRITPAFVEAMIVGEAYFHFPFNTKTICNITLYNGFSVTGESACASPENFNDELGRQIARKKAVERIWDFAGFWLRQKLWEASGSTAPEHEPFRLNDAAGAKASEITDETAPAAISDMAARLQVSGLLQEAEAQKFAAAVARG